MADLHKVGLKMREWCQCFKELSSSLVLGRGHVPHSIRLKRYGNSWGDYFVHLFFFFQYVLNPTFTKDDITQLDRSAKLSRAFDGTTYLPGIIFISICLKDIFLIINISKHITSVRKWLSGAVIEKCRRKWILFQVATTSCQKSWDTPKRNWPFLMNAVEYRLVL